MARVYLYISFTFSIFMIGYSAYGVNRDFNSKGLNWVSIFFAFILVSIIIIALATAYKVTEYKIKQNSLNKLKVIDNEWIVIEKPIKYFKERVVTYLIIGLLLTMLGLFLSVFFYYNQNDSDILIQKSISGAILIYGVSKALFYMGELRRLN